MFLLLPVGSKGSVLSVEVREDHHKRAVSNYQRWRTSWSLRRGQEWPDNVDFHTADLAAASTLLAGRGFHAVSGSSAEFDVSAANPCLFIVWILSAAGRSGHDQPTAGATHCSSTPAPWSRVRRLPCQVRLSTVAHSPFNPAEAE